MQYAHHDDITLAHETFGDPGGEPLLLISGTGVQMLIWPDTWCTALADHGYAVTRFDNRDAGLSTHPDVPAPGWLRALLRPSTVPYALADLADDAFAVMDALGWSSAHVVGASMGGMIAQVMATRRPDRVRSLTSIMSTPSSWIGMRPKLSTIRTIMRIGGTPAQDPDQAGEQALEVKRAMTTQRYPLDEDLVRDIGRRSFERRPDDEASDLRQRAAVIASGDRRKALARLRLPALVLHGEDDPVIRVKAGRATARAIPGAQLVTYPGLGHDLPAALWPDIIARLTALTAPTGSAGPPVGAVERGAQAGSAASIDRRSSSIESGR